MKRDWPRMCEFLSRFPLGYIFELLSLSAFLIRDSK